MRVSYIEQPVKTTHKERNKQNKITEKNAIIMLICEIARSGAWIEQYTGFW